MKITIVVGEPSDLLSRGFARRDFSGSEAVLLVRDPDNLDIVAGALMDHWSDLRPTVEIEVADG